MSGQANHDADPEDPVQGPLPGSLLPKLGQVRLHPGQGARIVDVDAERSGLVGERVWIVLRSSFSGHGRTSCQPVRVPASLRPSCPACCPHQTDGSTATTLALLLAPSAGHALEVRPLAGEAVQLASVAMRARPPSGVRRPRTAARRPPAGRRLTACSGRFLGCGDCLTCTLTWASVYRCCPLVTRGCRSFAGPSGGTGRARAARMNVAQAWRRWVPARAMSEVRPR